MQPFGSNSQITPSHTWLNVIKLNQQTSFAFGAKHGGQQALVFNTSPPGGGNQGGVFGCWVNGFGWKGPRSINSQVDANYHAYAGTWDAANNANSSVWRDSVNVTSSVSTGNGSVSNTGGFGLDTYGVANNSYVFVCLWLRTLTSGELARVTNDPFCFLLDPLDSAPRFLAGVQIPQAVNLSSVTATTLTAHTERVKQILANAATVQTVNKAADKRVNVTSATSTIAGKLFFQNVLAALSTGVSMVRGVGKRVVTALNGATTVDFPGRRVLLITVSAVGAVSVTKLASRLVSMTRTTSTTTRRQGLKISASALSTAVTLPPRQIGKVVSVLAPGVVSVNKALTRALAVMASITQLAIKNVIPIPIVTDMVITIGRTLKTSGLILSSSLTGNVTFGSVQYWKMVFVSSVGAVSTVKAMTYMLPHVISTSVAQVLRSVGKRTTPAVVASEVSRPRLSVNAVRVVPVTTTSFTQRSAGKRVLAPSTVTQSVIKRTGRMVQVLASGAVTARKAVSRTLSYVMPVAVIVNKRIPQLVTAPISLLTGVFKITGKRVAAPSSITQTNARRTGRIVQVSAPSTTTVRRGVFKRVLAACVGVVTATWSGSQTFQVLISSSVAAVQSVRRTTLKLVSAPASTATSTEWHRVFFVVLTMPVQAGVALARGVSKRLFVVVSIVQRVRAWYYDRKKLNDGRVLRIETRNKRTRFPRVKARYSFFSKREDF